METQARYGIIGAFTLAVIGAAFLFVFWLHTTGGVGAESQYRLRFSGSVVGLRAGSSVMFNGIKVGEVKSLQYDPSDPLKIDVLIGVATATPIRTDTRVVVETQGLMGSPAILLGSGTSTALLPPGPGGTPPLLEVGAAASETLTQSALGVLRRMDKLLADNSEPFSNIVNKISVFSDALGRNAGRIDTIAESLDKMLGGGKDKKPAVVYDLAAPKTFAELKKPPAAKFAVLEPSALVVFDTQKILLSTKPNERMPLADGQLSDSLPRLLQAKLVESFENAGYLGHVQKGNDAGTADLSMQVDIRNFQVATEGKPTAVIELSVKLQSGEGQVVAARIFRSEAPAESAEPEPAAKGLSDAFGKLVGDLVVWVNEAG